jgi:hypothetical protein
MIATRSDTIVATLRERCSGTAHFTKNDLLIQRSCSKKTPGERADGTFLPSRLSIFPDSSTVEQPAVAIAALVSNDQWKTG